jgi:hypothetical protein
MRIASAIRRPLWSFVLPAATLLLILSACGSLTPKGQAAMHEQSKLQTLLQQAITIGVPKNLLAPIRQQEQRVNSQLVPGRLFSGQIPDSTYEHAIASYRQLESEVINITNQATQTAQVQAFQNLQAFDQILQERQHQGYDISVYQVRMTQIETAYNNSQTPGDFQKVSDDAEQQTLALQLMWSTDQQLQALQETIKQMKDAGFDVLLGQQECQNDLTTFRAASQPGQYKKLIQIISAQQDQLAADQVATIPVVGGVILDQLQQLISQAQSYGEDVANNEQQLQQDREELQLIKTASVYLPFATKVRSQIDAIQLVWARGKTQYDLQQLQNMIGMTNIQNDYEYRDGPDALGDQRTNFQNAKSLEDYQAIDGQLMMLLTNLQALLNNLKVAAAPDDIHPADLQLIRYYHLTGKVMVTSLTEQTLRLYENGQFVKGIPLVTGRQERPSPPGLWHIFFKGTNVIFHSSEPLNSPLWSPPSLIRYAMEYHEGGFYYHDATWRKYFGPGANMPHDDYTSGKYSDDGSHGCINMTLANAAWLYSWVQVGTPAIIY